MKHTHFNQLSITLASLLLPATLAAAEDSKIDFVKDVRPIFQEHCYSCHGEKKQKNSYRLDVKSVALTGGDHHAPNIIPGESADSPLIHFVTGQDKDIVMPKKGDRLSKKEISILTKWIDQGAVWPDGVDLAKVKDRTNHWSFKPLTTQDKELTIDHFIKKKLKESGLKMSPETDKVSWIRRAYFNLTGIAPAPEKVETFLADKAPGARKRVVDELLLSSRYGEHWGQHWLDVVRYADTDGFEVNTSRPNAWPYRDYVIRAFNEDKPYDQFITDQLAGDSTGEDAATGFLVTAARLLPGQIGKDAVSMRLARQDELGEIIINTSDSFLGISVGCARCHNHKFDPISAKDYYSFQAFFAGVHYGDRSVKPREKKLVTLNPLKQIDAELAYYVAIANNGKVRPFVRSRSNIDRFTPVKTKRVRFTIAATNQLAPCIDELEIYDQSGNNIALAAAGATATFSGSFFQAGRHGPAFINDGKYGNASSWMSNEDGKGWVVVEFENASKIDRVVWGRDRQGAYNDRLAKDYTIEIQNKESEWVAVASSMDREPYNPENNAEAPIPLEDLDEGARKRVVELLIERKPLAAQVFANVDLLRVFAGSFTLPHATHLLNRGDAEQLKEKVGPDVPALFRGEETLGEISDSERRMALAKWIASPENPLAARVMVNRIWQWHFGMGLVETANDFGNMGTKPSHPKLLDWLAAEFISSGWSVKHMQRLITLSEAYRQASRVIPEATAKDAGSRLLWRFPSRRIDAESIRDTMLSCSGRLNLTMGGPGFDLFKSRGGLNGFPPIESFDEKGLRRMIYSHKIRMEKEVVFGGFDHPDAGQSAARRPQSTTPIQALNLFNSRFTMEEATAFAKRITKEVGADPAKQVSRAYSIAYSRQPNAVELKSSLEFVKQHDLPTLCRVIYNSNEFLFIP